jgi:hypothetical protein
LGIPDLRPCEVPMRAFLIILALGFALVVFIGFEISKVVLP